VVLRRYLAILDIDQQEIDPAHCCVVLIIILPRPFPILTLSCGREDDGCVIVV